MNPKVEYKTKNVNNHIAFTAQGSAINFNDEMTLNLMHYERDEQVHLIIARNRWGMLVIGGEQGGSYVAEIVIPARGYETVAADGGEMQSFAAASIGVDASGDNPENQANVGTGNDAGAFSAFPDDGIDGEGGFGEDGLSIEKIPVPFEMGRVSLILWEVQG